MKRVKEDLYSKIITLESLYKAAKNAQKGKKKHRSVIKFNSNYEENIQNLHLSLLNKTYKVGEYSLHTIYEPKKREITNLKNFEDRILHHAIILHLEDIFVNSFISQTYSCIKKRGIHKCLNTLTKYLKNEEETHYCLKFDVKKFYRNVDLNILKIKLSNKFKDVNLLNLLFQIINSYEEGGLPLGHLTSQYLANFYLNSFDHYIKEKLNIKYYLRYCDDAVILHRNKEYLHKIRSILNNYLNKELNLEMSNYQVFPVKSRGIDFLGYPSYHNRIKLRDSIKRRFIKMTKRNKNDKSIASYYGWIKHCNGINLWNKYIKTYEI